jgi:hypothetical protein
MTFETTATRVWKRLSPAERMTAARLLFDDPTPETTAVALGAITRARKMRPQAVRAMAAADQARAVGSILDPGEALAASLLVALHLGERRALLRAFLDALGLPHEDGILSEQADAMPAVTADAAKAAVAGLQAFPPEQVATYLNTLYLQDPDRWGVLEGIGPS